MFESNGPMLNKSRHNCQAKNDEYVSIGAPTTIAAMATMISLSSRDRARLSGADDNASGTAGVRSWRRLSRAEEGDSFNAAFSYVVRG